MTESPLPPVSPEQKPSPTEHRHAGQAVETQPVGVHRSSRFFLFSALQTIIGFSVIAATLFTLFNPRNFFNGEMLNSILLALQSTPESLQAPTPVKDTNKPRIGIVAGHSGHDSGAVCKDGLTEASLNMTIATLVRQDLLKDGFQVDLLQEFDPLLENYQALALISIHNDSCDYIDDEATGYKVSAAQGTKYPEKTHRLGACLIDRYAAATGLKFDANRITNDMSQYHAFTEINPTTPAVIIETGYMNLDRQMLTDHPDIIASGITNGILCYTNNEIIPTKAAPQ